MGLRSARAEAEPLRRLSTPAEIENLTAPYPLWWAANQRGRAAGRAGALSHEAQTIVQALLDDYFAEVFTALNIYGRLPGEQGRFLLVYGAQFTGPLTTHYDAIASSLQALDAPDITGRVVSNSDGLGDLVGWWALHHFYVELFGIAAFVGNDDTKYTLVRDVPRYSAACADVTFVALARSIDPWDLAANLMMLAEVNVAIANAEKFSPPP